MTVQHPAAKLLDMAPFSLGGGAKRAAMMPLLHDLGRSHYERCPAYRLIVDRVFGGPASLVADSLERLPFLPVSLFKAHVLRSVSEADTFKVLTSSGTTGQAVSRIYLDAPTAQAQAVALVRVAQHFLGRERMPMVVVDSPDALRDRQSFSARGAGILGMLQFGRRPVYALRPDLGLDLETVEACLAEAAGRPVLFFGFTSLVWQYLVCPLREQGRRLPASSGVLVHSGGWKKMQDLAVDPATFRQGCQETLGVKQVINYYGMVEQVGGVFFENERHYHHAPIFSDVLVRDPYTLQVVPDGQIGLLQVFSVLPASYPGHSLLTEDLGVVRGEAGPESPMQGRWFEVLGRAPRSERRGCSDTFAGGGA